jgi:hypothetical protein
MTALRRAQLRPNAEGEVPFTCTLHTLSLSRYLFLDLVLSLSLSFSHLLSLALSLSMTALLRSQFRSNAVGEGPRPYALQGYLAHKKMPAP